MRLVKSNECCLALVPRIVILIKKSKSHLNAPPFEWVRGASMVFNKVEHKAKREGHKQNVW